MNDRKSVILVGAGLVVLVAVALSAIDAAPLSEGAKRIARKTLLTGAGLAIATLFGVAAIFAGPAWVGIALTVGVLVSTGAYALLSEFAGLPELPQGGASGGSGAEVPCGAWDPATGTVRLCHDY